MSLRINEIFYSIQGESLYAGLPCVFIRLTGCNLRCAYCDTRYAHDEGTDMTISEILARIESYPASALVEITGAGSQEPMLVPFARAIFVEIDIGARRLVVELPEGLAGLNGP